MDDLAYCKRHNQRISLSDGCPACDADSRECEHCIHYRAFTASMVAYVGGHPKVVGLCTLDRPLVPCEYFEREPGADDE